MPMFCLSQALFDYYYFKRKIKILARLVRHRLKIHFNSGNRRSKHPEIGEIERRPANYVYYLLGKQRNWQRRTKPEELKRKNSRFFKIKQPHAKNSLA